MARLHVNPTRMELSSIRKRLKVAVRGHKLLKDKRDEMMRKFVDFVRENQKLRKEVEKELTEAMRDFLMARAAMSSESLETAVLMPSRTLNIDVSTKNIMSINVPVFNMKQSEGASPYPYGLLDTSGELDEAISRLDKVLKKMIELAEMEKACNMLADEIEKTRRRVNALEYVMIPDMEETIKYIKMKLDESERGAQIRLMKVKDMIDKQKVQD
jgi:V/A-type H+-transporting ATPase subunit D